jgi:H+/gluconate symporter-like permease
VVLRYLLSAAGDITTSDVDLAAASGGMVVGFNLSPDEGVLAHAKQMGASHVCVLCVCVCVVCVVVVVMFVQRLSVCVSCCICFTTGCCDGAAA